MKKTHFSVTRSQLKHHMI